MSAKRKGTITYIDLEGNSGIIVDENSQDISFSLEDVIGKIGINMAVLFDIDFKKNGLIAINVEQHNLLK